LRVKRFLSFLPSFLLAAGWLTLAGCSLPAVSPADRAYALVAGLNASSRECLADNFLPTIADYATLLDPSLYPAIWDPILPYVNAPYTVTTLDASNPAAVNLSLEDKLGAALPVILLVMDKLGNDWFILRMEMPSPTVIVD
jgi:hypothetical protein